MYSSSNNTLYYGQQKSRCYCQNGKLCYCTGIENPSQSSRTSHKFIQVRKDKNENKSASFSSTKSFSPVPVPTMLSSISPSFMTTAESCCSEPQLTDRRELYERCKGDIHQDFNMGTWSIKEQLLFSKAEPELFSNEQIIKLQEFRLQNANECLSSCSSYTMDKIKRIGVTDEIVAEPKYRLNNRGLLEATNGNYDNLAAIVTSKSVVKDILRQKMNSSKNKDKFVRKALCVPENSLALRYQKTY